MDMKTLKNKTTEWWDKHKTTVKLVVVSTSIGVLYGFIKGMSTANNCWLDVAKVVTAEDETTKLDHIEVSDPAYVNFVEEGRPTQAFPFRKIYNPYNEKKGVV